MGYPRITVDEASERVVESYREYERSVRRLGELTVKMTAYHVRHYLAWRIATDRGVLGQLSAEELQDYVVQEASRLSHAATRNKLAMLRTFTRFCFATGITATDLSRAVPRVSGIRFDGLPRSVEPETVTALLASCRREHANGRRDYAILLLMSRLGLRAIEVARLELGDFDWRAGVVVVRGKSGRLDLMPIPEEVGAAIADYLACRRSSPSRAVFLQAGGEAVAMSRNAVVFVSRTASQRAGIAVVGGHRLRHTTATQLLRHGASLREVAELLRQSDIVTTSTYAKIDQASLSLAVQSWPQEAGR